MEGGRDTEMRVFNIVKFGLCGSILAISLVQGFMPGVEISAMWPGIAGFLIAATSTAKIVSVI